MFLFLQFYTRKSNKKRRFQWGKKLCTPKLSVHSDWNRRIQFQSVIEWSSNAAKIWEGREKVSLILLLDNALITWCRPFIQWFPSLLWVNFEQRFLNSFFPLFISVSLYHFLAKRNREDVCYCSGIKCGFLLLLLFVTIRIDEVLKEDKMKLPLTA